MNSVPAGICIFLSLHHSSEYYVNERISTGEISQRNSLKQTTFLCFVFCFHLFVCFWKIWLLFFLFLKNNMKWGEKEGRISGINWKRGKTVTKIYFVFYVVLYEGFALLYQGLNLFKKLFLLSYIFSLLLSCSLPSPSTLSQGPHIPNLLRRSCLFLLPM